MLVNVSVAVFDSDPVTEFTAVKVGEFPDGETETVPFLLKVMLTVSYRVIDRE
jgi:hypothetical protein